MRVSKLTMPMAFCVSLMFSGCGKTLTEWRADTTWEYINESSYSLEIDAGAGLEAYNFALPKDGKHSMDIEFGVGEEVSIDEFYPPYNNREVDAILDGDQRVTTSAISNIENYTSEKTGKREFKFTYTFTDADFAEEK